MTRIARKRMHTRWELLAAYLPPVLSCPFSLALPTLQLSNSPFPLKRIRATYRKFKTHRRTKDLDQIEADLVKLASGNTIDPAYNLTQDDLPAGGDHHCPECSRYFVSFDALARHKASKVHRRRLKELKEGSFSQKEAENAVGISTDSRQRMGKPVEDKKKHEGEDVSMAT